MPDDQPEWSESGGLANYSTCGTVKLSTPSLYPITNL